MLLFVRRGLCLVAVSTFLVACGNDAAPGATADAGSGGSDARVDGHASGGTSAAGAGGSGGVSGSAGKAGAATGGSSGTAGSSGAAGASDDASVPPPRDGGADADAGPRAPCSPPANIDAPLAKLSETGCMDATDPTKLASFVLPYEVNSPLWSDSADKLRGMRLPDGGKIHVKNCAKEPTSCLGAADDGKWLLPVGTVMVKSFLFDDKLVETRLFVHFDATTWVGYSYEWDEAQTDATIVPDVRRNVTFDTGKRKVDWNYPSRLDCMQCHNDPAGASLGPETAQMNRAVGGKNQIDTWLAMGLFDAALAKPYKTALVLPYAGQLGTPPAGATLDQKARSYLHANCAFCHRPDGDFASLDMRYDTPFKDMGLCGATPAKGDQGVNGALVLAPSMPMDSVTWLRMNAPPGNNGRMPKIGSYHVDDQGLALVGDWITGIKSCP